MSHFVTNLRGLVKLLALASMDDHQLNVAACGIKLSST